MRRRSFNQILASAIAAALAPGIAHGKTPTQLRAAAIQMQPKLADVEANLAQAEQLIHEAQHRGADWIVLPEMFTTAAAFHTDMIRAIRPIDGAPAQLLRRMARAGHCTIGASFLAVDRGKVFNSFLLVHPDGQMQRHDKDLPTYWENCVNVGGDDDGVLDTPIGPVGVALCWELIRSQTARRLVNKVRLAVGGSCWWTLPDDAPADHPLRATNLAMLKQAPVDLARMLGVPVIHGSHAGPFAGFFSPELPDVPYDSSYLGEACIVDSQGGVKGSRSLAEGAGVVIADIELPAAPQPGMPIPDRYWTPVDMPREWQESFERWFETGGDYYREVTEHYLASGEIPEYLPPYMR